MKNHSSTCFNQRGVGLIEVLIAVLVVAVGVLGSIAMQLSSKRMGHEAVQRTMAANLARDLIERMRSNPAALDSYVLTWRDGTDAPTVDYSCLTGECTNIQLALYDQAQWMADLEGAAETRVLTQGEAAEATGGLQRPSVCITNNSRFVTVAIAWRGFQEMSNPGLSTCGEGSGLYDGVNEGDDDVYRQVLTFSSYIKEL